jgi:sortase B
MRVKKTVFIIFLTVFIVALVNVVMISVGYLQSRQYYSGIADLADLTTQAPDTDTEQGELYEKTDYPKVDFEALESKNSDVVAWIYINDTPVNYPVVQGKDNAFYLKHLFDKSYGVAGCVFLDCKNESDFSGFNNIIYGHRMRDNSMFSSIEKYKKQDYFDQHPQAIIVTPQFTYAIDFFSGYVADTSQSSWKTVFEAEDEKEQWLNELKSKSLIQSPVEPSISDRIITLSTCSHDFDDARFVLHGVLRYY